MPERLDLPAGKLAWGDESGSNQEFDPGAYVLGAVIIEPSSVEDVRNQMRKLLLPGQRKVHWWRESPKRRDQICKVIAGSDIEALVVARVGSLDERDERRRRKCLESFLPALATIGCGKLTLESRGVKLDQRDLDLVRALQSSFRLAPDLRIAHTPGPTEPLLWAADTLCGAVTSARMGNTRWLDQIETGVKVFLVNQT